MNYTDEIIFSGNSAIDAYIKEMLLSFSPESQKRMKKAILAVKKAAEKYQDENTDAGARHIFREFIPASILNRSGFSFEYETSICGKKPDWLDDTAKMMMESYTYERGGSSFFISRVTTAISGKCNKYKNIIEENSLRFILAVYLDFLSGMLLEECYEDAKTFLPIFDANSSLWAILFFTETRVVNYRQEYGFFCLCRDSTFKAFSNWPFGSMQI